MPRFYIGVTENEKEIWKAASTVAEANFLVTAELSFSGQDAKPAERFKAALLALGKEATQHRQIAKYCWIFFLESGLNEVFQTLVDHLGV